MDWGWVPYFLAWLGTLAACVFVPAVFAYGLSRLAGARLAFIGANMRAWGRNPRALKSLAFVEWLSPEDVATLLSVELDDVAANLLMTLRPRFARKVLGCMGDRRERIEYWLDHPQPFPRAEQMALARRFKVALRRTGRLPTAT